MVGHPSLTLLSAPFGREDLFLVVYCLVDDWLKARFGRSNVPRRRRGPGPHDLADAEVLTLLLVGELCHSRHERAWLRQVRASYAALFPALPTDSRFARRAARLRQWLRPLRATLLYWADADLEPVRILDSFPLSLCACYRIRQSSLPIDGATFGWNAAKRQYYYGLRPQLLLTGSGFVVDLIPAPGNCNDTPGLAAYLDECVEAGRDLTGQVWLMDQGYRNPRLAHWAQERLGLTLLAHQPPRREALPSSWQALLDRFRQPVEAVLAVLTGCFGIEHILAKSEVGVDRRLQAKATAFTLARYFNRILDREPLDIAHYAV